MRHVPRREVLINFFGKYNNFVPSGKVVITLTKQLNPNKGDKREVVIWKNFSAF